MREAEKECLASVQLGVWQQLIIEERSAERPRVQLGLECEFVLEPVLANFSSNIQQQASPDPVWLGLVLGGQGRN